jgi:hypothetical protein
LNELTSHSSELDQNLARLQQEVDSMTKDHSEANSQLIKAQQ